MDRTWVTLAAADSDYLLRDERGVLARGPTNRSLRALLANTRLAWRVVRRERPAAILSTGAALAVPFFLAGKLHGARLVYVESLTRTTSLSLAGRLVYPLADAFFVQWPERPAAAPATSAGCFDLRHRRQPPDLQVRTLPARAGNDPRASWSSSTAPANRPPTPPRRSPGCPSTRSSTAWSGPRTWSATPASARSSARRGRPHADRLPAARRFDETVDDHQLDWPPARRDGRLIVVEGERELAAALAAAAPRGAAASVGGAALIDAVGAELAAAGSAATRRRALPAARPPRRR